MKPVGFAALVMLTAMPAAMPAASLAAQPEGKAALDKSDVDQPITRAEIGSKLDADFADMDSDHDGKVTAAEIDARLIKSAEAKLDAIKKERDAAFARLDINGDGTITRAEFDEKAKLPTIKQPDAAPVLAEFDANKDGAITLEEFREPTLANFTKMDVNHDGTVTPSEAKSALDGPAAPAKAPAKKPTFKNTPSITR